MAASEYVVKNCINKKSVKLLIMRSDVLLRSFTEITQEPGSVIDIVTRLRARRPRDRSLISGGGKRFISCPLGPDRV